MTLSMYKHTPKVFSVTFSLIVSQLSSAALIKHG